MKLFWFYRFFGFASHYISSCWHMLGCSEFKTKMIVLVQDLNFKNLTKTLSRYRVIFMIKVLNRITFQIHCETCNKIVQIYFHKLFCGIAYYIWIFILFYLIKCLRFLTHINTKLNIFKSMIKVSNVNLLMYKVVCNLLKFL